MKHEKEHLTDTVENNRRVHERAMGLRSRVEDSSTAQDNWGTAIAEGHGAEAGKEIGEGVSAVGSLVGGVLGGTAGAALGAVPGEIVSGVSSAAEEASDSVPRAVGAFDADMQLNWGGPAMTPSAVPAMPMGRPTIPDAPQPGSSGLSGVDAICNFTNIGGRR